MRAAFPRNMIVTLTAMLACLQPVGAQVSQVQGAAAPPANEIAFAQAGSKLPPVGDTVDVATTWTNTIGPSELSVERKDADSRTDQRALYYARVIEIPTPLWTAYDRVRFGIRMGKEVPMKHRDRAWTSPIWHTPV